MPFDEPNSANTLSLRYRPGEQKRLLNTGSESLFTFGDFRLQKSYVADSLSGTPLNLQFDGFSTLDSLRGTGIATDVTYYVKQNELKNPATEATTYAYFSSFYKEVAASISNIVDNYPYAALSYNAGTGTTIYGYSEVYNHSALTWYSEFKVPLSAITNQGSLAFNSGSSVTNMSLATDFDEFSVQFSGETDAYQIVNYSFSSATSPYLYFEIRGRMDNMSGGTNSTDPLYIRPTSARINEYKRNISKLEKHLLDDGTFDVPDIEYSDGTYYKEVFAWPKVIDGLNPDISGTDFETYKTSVLSAAEKIDEEKTNIFVKNLIPDGYLENDSPSELLGTIIQSFAHEFDILKRYIDAMAYAHNINYSEEESTPNKMLFKLSNLLGWKLSDSFSEIDLFEYLVGEDNDEENSGSYYNLQIWKRILVNLVWLYKKKGTRDALSFIFRLLGAPDCLITFDEFIYKINQATPSDNLKINSQGYINYNESQYIFQEGGEGRGDGQKYINQWMPEFTPEKSVDNKKTYTGDTLYGTQQMINSKEINIGFDPAKAVECDVFQFYQQSSCTCYDFSVSATCPNFSSVTMPQEYWATDCSVIQPDSITGMTLDKYLEYVYTKTVEPTGRKNKRPIAQKLVLPRVKKAYLNYYHINNPTSNKLTIKKLESYLALIERNLGDYIIQLLPATTIFGQLATTYRNPIFYRQKFVYRNGVNTGSEFKTGLPPAPSDSLSAIRVSGGYVAPISPDINVISISSKITGTIGCNMKPITTISTINSNSFYNLIAPISVGSVAIGTETETTWF